MAAAANCTDVSEAPLAEEVPKDTICFDFTKGKCNRSAAACKFSHDPEVIARVNGREKGVCYDWQYGTCMRGQLCRFSHRTEDLHEQQAKQALKQQVIVPIPCRCPLLQSSQFSDQDSSRVVHSSPAPRIWIFSG